MNRIAQLAHVRKRAKVEKLAHCVRVQGSADYYLTVADNTQNLRGHGGNGNIKGLSKNSLARLRDAIARTEHKEGKSRVYGVCLTLPWGDRDNSPGSPTQADGAEIWRSWTHHLGRFLDTWHAGAIYRVELQQRGAVHWHLMLYLPCEMDRNALLNAFVNACMSVRGNASPITTAKTKAKRPMLDTGSVRDEVAECHLYFLSLLRISWINTLVLWRDGAASGRALARLSCQGTEPPPAPVRTWDYCVNAIYLDGVKSGVAYLASHTTKHKQEQLGWTGKQWGFLGKKWLQESQPVNLVAEPSHPLRIAAYRLIRKWARRNAYHTDWRAVKPRRLLVGENVVYCGLVIRNTRTVYIFGSTQAIVGRAFECAEKAADGRKGLSGFAANYHT